MSEKEFYKENIVKMISTIHNAEWLRSIYSFIKVFVDDSRGEEKHGL